MAGTIAILALAAITINVVTLYIGHYRFPQGRRALRWLFPLLGILTGMGMGYVLALPPLLTGVISFATASIYDQGYRVIRNHGW